MASPAIAANGSATVNIFDGTRKPFSDGKILITIMDGNHKTVHKDFHRTASTPFTDLPVFDNFGDNYTFVASAGGYQDAGIAPVHIARGTAPLVDLMLLPKRNAFNFSKAKWDGLLGRPKLRALLATGATDAAAARYSDLEDTQGGAVLACLLNITTVADQCFLPQGTVLDYFKEVIWDLKGDSAMAQDRFYAWADPTIIEQLENSRKSFAPAPHGLHKGADLSFKQIEFGEANLQLTFHTKDRYTVNGVNCVRIEPDIDYYHDKAAHLLLEVAANAFGGLTDPRAVYVLRWIAGRRAGTPEFDPLYTIQKA